MITEQQLQKIFEAYVGPRPDVYCDLDGVLANFQKGVQETFPEENLSDYKKLHKFLTKKESWNLVKQTNPHLFRNLPLMAGANELMRRLLNFKKLNYINLKILSAYPNEWHKDSEMRDICIKDKIYWVKTNFPFIQKEDIIICLRKDKPLYGKKSFESTGIRPLLIDDLKINIQHWRYEGFQGILYENPKQAISEINQYMTVIAHDAIQAAKNSASEKI